jgi:hypothetical protein
MFFRERNVSVLFAILEADWENNVAGIGLIILVLFLVFVLPVILLNGGLYVGSGALRRYYLDIVVHERPQPGDVSFVYHTYSGLFVWFWQMEHRVNASLEDSEKLLGRLLRFNLTWGLLAPGMVFIPMLALGNFYVQKRNIGRQAAQLRENRGQLSE